MELKYEELTFNEKVAQGGFSIVYKGEFRGTGVAIKKIFNPKITEEVQEEL